MYISDKMKSRENIGLLYKKVRDLVTYLIKKEMYWQWK